MAQHGAAQGYGTAPTQKSTLTALWNQNFPELPEFAARPDSREYTHVCRFLLAERNVANAIAGENRRSSPAACGAGGSQPRATAAQFSGASGSPRHCSRGCPLSCVTGEGEERTTSLHLSCLGGYSLFVTCDVLELLGQHVRMTSGARDSGGDVQGTRICRGCCG